MGRGNAKQSDRLIVAAHRILKDIHPASVRAVCYKLFTERLIPSMAKKETDRVSKLLTRAREYNLIPWDWIVDETRKAEGQQAVQLGVVPKDFFFRLGGLPPGKDGPGGVQGFGRHPADHPVDFR